MLQKSVVECHQYAQSHVLGLFPEISRLLNAQHLAEPVIETILYNIDISMTDINGNVMLDQVDVNLILRTAGYQILDRTENWRVLNDNQIHTLFNGFSHRFFTNIEKATMTLWISLSKVPICRPRLSPSIEKFLRAKAS